MSKSQATSVESVSLKAASKESKRSDRRRNARASVMIPVRLRPVKFNDGNFVDTTTTLNVCRGNLLVASWRDDYTKGMHVLVTYPYLPSGKGGTWEYVGEVTRLDAQPDGRFRIAIKLLSVLKPASKAQFEAL